MLFETNWTSADYFNAADYNRLKSNIEALRALAVKYYPTFDISAITAVTAGTVPTYAALNAIESNIELLADKTYRSQLFEDGKTFSSAGGIAWNYEDLNRLESNLQLTYDTIIGKAQGALILKFELGGGLFG